MERDHIHESPARKSGGASLVALARAATAATAPMPWWGTTLVLIVAWCGLHMVAGLKFKWKYPEW